MKDQEHDFSRMIIEELEKSAISAPFEYDPALGNSKAVPPLRKGGYLVRFTPKNPCAYRIRELMDTENMTATDLAEETGVKKALMMKIAQGQRHPTASITRKIARYFGVSEGYVLGCE